MEEINARMRRMGLRLNYHNGLMQISGDDLVDAETDGPFWEIVSDITWRNVDTDMKHAVHLRDTSGRDPAFYAAKSLESALKIISDKECYRLGRRKGRLLTLIISAASVVDILSQVGSVQF